MVSYGCPSPLALLTALVLFMGFVCLACDRTEITDAGPKLEPAAKLNGRHVIVISFDTLRVDHLGFMGNDWIRTPRLDSLAETSIVFEDHQTVVPTTLASHSTIFTGNHPHHHGTPGNGWMVNSKNDMLAEVLKRAGFVTAGFVASFALESRFGIAQGFDHYSEEFDVLVGERAADQNHRSAEAVTNAVLEYLDAEPTPENLFLFIHYFDPHHPYSETGSFVDLYANADIPLVVHPARTTERLRALRLARRYAAEVSYLDHHVGRLLLGLQVRGILDDSILVVTSDHGENFIEHGESFNHGLTVYEPATRSLWLMRMPRAEKGGMRITGPTSSVDIFPTLLAELGLEPSSDVDGMVIALSSEPAREDRARFSEAARSLRPGPAHEGWRNLDKPRAIRRGAYKLIQVPKEGREELYDVRADPAEQRDLLEDPTPQIAAIQVELRGLLEAWAESADPLPSRREVSQAAETRERLEALGYLVE